MSYTVVIFLTSGKPWALVYDARYLSKGIDSLYFTIANIKRYTVYMPKLFQLVPPTKFPWYFFGRECYRVWFEYGKFHAE